MRTQDDNPNKANRANLFKTGLIYYEALNTTQRQAVRGVGAVDVSTLGVHSVLTSINLAAYGCHGETLRFGGNRLGNLPSWLPWLLWTC